MVAYFKNQNPSQKGVTFYERANEEKPNLKHLQVISSRAGVYILEKMRKKLNNRAWQEIFVSYEGNSFYKIYHSFIRKIYQTSDIDIDESLLYHKSKINPWDFVNVKWENLNDSFFADPLKFDSKEAETNIRSAPITPKKKR